MFKKLLCKIKGHDYKFSYNYGIRSVDTLEEALRLFDSGKAHPVFVCKRCNKEKHEVGIKKQNIMVVEELVLEKTKIKEDEPIGVYHIIFNNTKSAFFIEKSDVIEETREFIDNMIIGDEIKIKKVIMAENNYRVLTYE